MNDIQESDLPIPIWMRRIGLPDRWAGEVVSMSTDDDEQSLMTSTRTQHQARSDGHGDWVVSFLPGRTFSQDQALAALRAADEWAAMQTCASLLGLTALELAGMAATECTWPPPKQSRSGRSSIRFWKGISR